ncbi:hypothetical protein FHS43_001131 [Streptosporangium becharense]|uniref:Uncharacterized protein n=1 Tax=Streptosporangium becharense TaxID=1816182 RepID=A0A7W9MFU5_9ACTN|nr:hypothetical protein [Streptosporangium becharense]MBB2909885.1 hypothetical protein [Streptosporangium becharense]MBB5819160.1 hypothetical protein [Streptosporangium becharense]
MSFELAVWHEPEPITREHAESVYRALRRGEPEAAAADPGAAGPAAEAQSAAVGTPSAAVEAPPGVAAFAARLPEAVLLSPAHALVVVEVERADEVAGAAFALARECGLVCYDPQRRLVHNPGPAGAHPGMQLHTGDGMIVTDPDLGLVRDVPATLSPENPFAALVVFGEHFVQASPEAGGYELEYKDSRRGLMLRTHVPALEAVRDAFAEYAAGGRGFLDRHEWQRV